MHTIALIDSGVGGLSILAAITAQLPNARIVYLADHQYAPYGEKQAQWVKQRIVDLSSSLVTTHAPDCIVIACNTASTLSLKALRAKLSTPIIGVVPAIKTAATMAHDTPIGVLATKATINGEYIHRLINDFASSHQVIKQASSELVTMAEQKLSGIAVDLISLKKIIQPLLDEKCKHVVLGCTHFPLLKPELEIIAPDVAWIDSSNAIAHRCHSLLSRFSTPVSQTNKPLKTFYSTAAISLDLTLHLKGLGFNSIQQKYSFTSEKSAPAN
ncbi:glutamate racemase [Oceaniserpentilla sp. 4NH20-0058]|uniref:glutamate racemase n=1 Tax=Oceaniserpentilla sp. 4NH20-0058 TaxID=3127660 RepID=UPI003103FBF4